MPSKRCKGETGKSETGPISFADWAADIAKRKSETGIEELPRNLGSRRNGSKRPLLGALENLGAKW
jgi:hypothetical protein